MLVSRMYFFFNKMLIQIFCPLLIRSFAVLLTCKSSSYILNMSPLPGIFFANILFLSIAYLFIFKSSVLNAQKSFIVMSFDLSISFMIHI